MRRACGEETRSLELKWTQLRIPATWQLTNQHFPLPFRGSSDFVGRAHLRVRHATDDKDNQPRATAVLRRRLVFVPVSETCTAAERKERRTEGRRERETEAKQRKKKGKQRKERTKRKRKGSITVCKIELALKIWIHLK